MVDSVDRHTVDAERLSHRLEEGRATGSAVATAAGGETVGGRTGVERTTTVATLGADGGPDQAPYRALGVVDGRVEGGHASSVDSRGAAPAGHRLVDHRRAGRRD